MEESVPQFPASFDLSSLDGSNGFRLRGELEYDRVGGAVGSAGDINNDGFADVVVRGRSFAYVGQEQRDTSYVIFGKSSDFTSSIDLSTLDGSTGFKLADSQWLGSGRNLGPKSVASAGDINDDGFADLIVGYDTNTSYVVLGKASGFAAAVDLSSLGSEGFKLTSAAGGFFGASVDSAGDVNGDGVDDMIIGAPASSLHGVRSGASYVVFGKASASPDSIDVSSLDGANGFKISGALANDGSGASVASAGDVNGDGFADVIVGGDTASHVIFGKASGFAANVDVSTLDGGNGFAMMGAFLPRQVTSGDINGDSFADMVVGDRNATVFVVFGKASGFDTTINLATLNGVDGFKVTGGTYVMGESVATADLNADGFADLIAGDELGAPSSAGTTYVMFGKASGFFPNVDVSTFDGTDGFKINGNAGDRSGSSVAAAGDVNGDGVDDVVVGAWLHDGPFPVWQVGAGYVVFGRAAGKNLTGTDAPDTLTGGAGDDTLSGLGGEDTLSGLAGQDTLDGGTGADTMTGGAGNDTYVVDAAGDVVTENPNEGGDTVRTTLASHALGANVEDLLFIGSGNFAGTGNALDNTITGGSGSDTLSGLTGNDTLDGGTDADVMIGGTGNDTYLVDTAGDLVTENPNEGSDTVRTTLASYTLGANVEGLAFTGSGTFAGVGNALANSISGGLGNDTLDGGTGADTMTGGAGNDTYFVDNSGDVVAESANAGSDTVNTTLSSYSLGANVESLMFTGAGNFTGVGNALANSVGGGLGDDTLDGGAGADTMIGGTGNDTYFVDTAGDVVTENPNEGSDTVRTTRTGHVLSANVEDLVFTGSGNFAGTGNSLANSITGGSGIDTLNGLAGNDMLDGGAGADTMVGAEGNDTYVVDTAGDVVSENAGEGTDTVRTGLFSYTLGANVENLVHIGTGTFIGTGNGLANSIVGSPNGNTLHGGAGDDSLTGGAMFDKLIGDDGNDTLVITPNSDLIPTEIREVYEGGAGSDTLQLLNATTSADLSRLLVKTVENLSGFIAGVSMSRQQLSAFTGTVDTGDITLTSAGAVDVSAADIRSQTINLSSVGNNALTIADSAMVSHTVNGGAGIDAITVTGGASGVSLFGNGASDRLTGGGGNDTLNGGADDDLLDGVAGADTMIGGAGNDTYLVDNVGDVVTENPGEGIDTVKTTLSSYTLGGDVDRLVFTGAGSFAGTGNELGNRITGGAGNDQLVDGAGSDILDGVAGADTMIGGAGNDTYLVDNVGDVVSENAGEGTDTVRTTLSSYTLGSNVEILVSTGTGDFAGIGTASDDRLKGGSGNDTLSGQSGNDILYGGAGTDRLIGGTGHDLFVFDAPLNAATNVDNIADFSVADDSIRLSQAIFTQLSAGFLPADAFLNAAAANDGSDRILYNSATGGLSYDSDGTGADAPMQFATLSPGLALTNHDFFVA